MSYGPGESRFVEEKRHFEKPIPISDLVVLDRERCILCDRCTRFAKDVAGDPLIHFQDRGNQTQVNTFPDHPFASYFSGNTVQICPVGALTATPYRFKARPWDLDQVESTCTGCSVGCRIVVQSSRNEVLRYQGVDIDPVNWGWLCDKGRFGFEAVNSDDRLGAPLVRQGDALTAAAWGDALAKAAAAIQAAEPGRVAVLGGARLTNEDAYAWAKLAKGVIGTDNVDAQLGDGLPAEVVLGLPRATIDEACAPGGTVLLLGPDLKEELPVLFLRLRHAVRRRRRQGRRARAAAHLGLRAGRRLAPAPPRRRPARSSPRCSPAEATARSAASSPTRCRPPPRCSPPVRSPSSSAGRALAESADGVVAAAAAIHAAHPEVRFLSALRRANVHGALDMGLVARAAAGPRRAWATADAWFHDGGWATVPRRDRPRRRRHPRGRRRRARSTCSSCSAPTRSPTSPTRALAARGARRRPHGHRRRPVPHRAPSAQADVVLAAAGFAEVDGTTTNLEGRVSTVARKVTPPGTARADWMIAAELARRLGADLGLDVGRRTSGPRSRRLAPGLRRPHPRGARRSEPPTTACVVPIAADAPATARAAPVDAGAGPAAARPTPPPASRAERARRSTPTRCAWSPPASSTTAAPPPSTRRRWPGLAPGGRLRLHPHDFDRLGVAAGRHRSPSSSPTRLGAAAGRSRTTACPAGSAAVLAQPAGRRRRTRCIDVHAARHRRAGGAVTSHLIHLVAVDPLLGGEHRPRRRPDRRSSKVRHHASLLLLVAVLFMIWFERKVHADMSNRLGPNRAGPFGILQTLADGIKFFFKEDLHPGPGRPQGLHPGPVPVGGPGLPRVRGHPDRRRLQRRRTTASITIVGHDDVPAAGRPADRRPARAGLSSIAVYGVMLAGWSSGSKYPLLGSVRASAQMVSYEAALGLSVVAVVLLAGSLSTHDIVLAQAGEGFGIFPRWNLIVTGVVPFVIFLIAGTAEMNRPPFDLVEAEQELVGGFHTEYSSIRFALFFLAEFMNTVTMSAIIVTLFLGGPAGPALFGPGLDVGLRLVLREAARLPLHVRLVPGHAAPVPLRPADGPRLEGAHPAVARLAADPGRHQRRPRRGLERRPRRRHRRRW